MKIPTGSKNVLFRFTLLLISFVLCGNLFAIKLDSLNTTLSPYFCIPKKDTTSIQFALLNTDVHVTISGVIADVEIVQTYVNYGDSTIEGNYIFPMSPNAAVYAMQMNVEDRIVKAVIMEKKDAQEAYEAAIDSGYTVTMLEQQYSNVFKMNLANIQPDDTIVVSMKYTELIVPEKGIYEYRFPTIIEPKYTDESRTEENISNDLETASVSIDVTINAGMPLEATCISHIVSVDYPEENKAYLEHTMLPEKDFIIDYILSGNALETGLLLFEGEEENFFLAMIQPPKADFETLLPQREYVFIMDVSGSMNGTPIEVSKAMISDLLYGLKPSDKFNIIYFAGASNIFSTNSVFATPENIEAAVNMSKDQVGSGTTYLKEGLKTALQMTGTEGYSRIFAILTDGKIYCETESLELIRNNLSEANCFSFGIGSSIRKEVIENIAFVGQGMPFMVLEDSDADSVANRFREYIENPVLTNIAVDYTGFNTYALEPKAIPDVFAERPILVYGKYEGSPQGSITISGENGDGVFTRTINLSDYTASADNIALQYLWAKQKITLLSKYGISDVENDTLTVAEEITQLGLQYSLVTDYTSFVAIDSVNRTTPVDVVDNNYEMYEDWTMYYASATDISEISYKKEQKSILTMVSFGDELELVIDNETFKYEEGMFLQITDVTGRVVKEVSLSETDFSTIFRIDITDLENGVYFISLMNGDVLMETSPFVNSK